MKRIAVMLLLALFTVSMVLFGVGCKEEAAEAAEEVEEAAEEVEEEVEEAAEEVEEAAEEVEEAAEEEQKVVKIGYLMPLSGPNSAWVNAQLTGLAMWLDEVNGSGGIEVGGEKYMVEMIKEDTENVPAKALEGAKKLVLEDGVVMIMQLQGAEISATQPFLNEHKIPVFTVCALDIGPDRPYVFSVGQNWPNGIPMGMQYVVDNYPEAKNLVFAGEDYDVSYLGRAFLKAGAEILGLNLVYDEVYAVDTLDFAPIADAIMAKDPDIFSPQGAYVSSQMLLIKELYLRGFDGVFFHEEWPYAELLNVVPKDYIVGRFITQAGYIGDDLIDPVGKQIYADWMARFGPGAPEDVKRDFIWIDWLGQTFTRAWRHGVELADSFEGEAVVKALESSDAIPHPFGTSVWTGEEMFGINHQLLIPQYITVCQEVDGALRDVTVAKYDVDEWFHTDDRIDVFVKYLKEEGVHYSQK
ncbi:MAG: ABC transporter substrate-binding protein [Deltaproteobacteria bacterium]|nr:ABC transporter substrate-binding protein [Deltaproteobacteria bacterium]